MLPQPSPSPLNATLSTNPYTLSKTLSLDPLHPKPEDLNCSGLRGLRLGFNWDLGFARSLGSETHGFARGRHNIWQIVKKFGPRWVQRMFGAILS